MAGGVNAFLRHATTSDPGRRGPEIENPDRSRGFRELEFSQTLFAAAHQHEDELEQVDEVDVEAQRAVGCGN